MDEHGFEVPKFSLQSKQTTNSPSPPPPSIIMKTKKRKREESNDKSTQNTNSKKPKLSSPTSNTNTPSIYSSPSWAQLPPKHYKFELEVIKNGVILNKISLNSKSHFIFGRDQQSVDIPTLHPSCSRIHAVLQHRKNGQWFLFDFGSTHFTKLNHKKLFPHKYYKIQIGNIIQFGSSQRMYILNGPNELQPMEQDINNSENPFQKQKKHVPTSTAPDMKSMMAHLANESKKQKTHKKSHKINVWGISDDFDLEQNYLNNDFDENVASENIHTKELYKELLIKRKQLSKLQNNLQQLLSKQRSDTELDQSQCMKIEKMRSKVDNIEYDIENICSKISGKLRGIYIEDDDNAYGIVNEIFDDDDDYYDRVKIIRHKKNDVLHRHALGRHAARDVGDKSVQIRGYDSYKDELDSLEMKISEIEQTLRDIEYRKNVNVMDKKKCEGGSATGVIDSILNDLKVNDNKYNDLKNELKDLRDKRVYVNKMVGVLKPAYFKIMENEPDRVKCIGNKKIDCLVKKKMDVKPGSLADIARKMKEGQMEKKKYEEKMEREAKERVLLREKEIKDAQQAKMDAMKKLKEREKEQEKKRMMLKLRDEENKNKVGLIVNKRNNVNRKGNNKLESEFAKILGNSGGVGLGGSDDDEVVCGDEGGGDDMEFVEEKHSTFLPPKNQTGDGKTWLNEKLGY